jgi:hypothetical protein
VFTPVCDATTIVIQDLSFVLFCYRYSCYPLLMLPRARLRRAGGDWTARVSARAAPGSARRNLTVVLYAGSEEGALTTQVTAAAARSFGFRVLREYLQRR